MFSLYIKKMFRRVPVINTEAGKTLYNGKHLYKTEMVFITNAFSRDMICRIDRSKNSI